MNLITNEDRSKRQISICPNSSLDYIDNDKRRIFPNDEDLILKDNIFEEHIALYLTNIPIKIKITNCEFKQGLAIRQEEIIDQDYSIFIYKSEIKECLSFNNSNAITIDSCELTDLFLSGKSSMIDLYRVRIRTLIIEHLKNDEISISQTEISKFKLYDFNYKQVYFDTDKLAISDYSKFITNTTQTKKDVSEIYHRFVLKSAKSIKSHSDINYQLTKSTSSIKAILFGYFHKPLLMVFYMLIVITLYAVIFTFRYDLTFTKALFESCTTFLTIGFPKTKDDASIIDIVLMFSEGIIGVTYIAALLISIINSSTKKGN
ncbi:hypothetical protein N6B72_11935 [Chryseobacterium soli]|uniref:hypothetical protein n=1 Tax=Chryseobacterium soli TaxID=445961 RepID=UPI0029534967|nr:hypothetical protein [Chryseobacterium soli]MDV7697633.1 hypothetical protein [Chryseobacterium soli]